MREDNKEWTDCYYLQYCEDKRSGLDQSLEDVRMI